MPAIQAMRSDALALRAKEDVQEKIPSFFNSVNKALGQNIIQGQDAAQQLAESRFTAANALAAQIRQKVDGQGGLSELIAGAGVDLIKSTIEIALALLSKTTTQSALNTASSIANFLLERESLKLQWEAAAATYAQWTVQAGYTGNGDFFPNTLGGSTTPAPQTRRVPVSQWVRAPAPAGGINKGPGNGNGNLFTGLQGMTFTGQNTDPPSDLVPFTFTDQNAAQEAQATGTSQSRGIKVGLDISDDQLIGLIGADGQPVEGDHDNIPGVDQNDGAADLLYSASDNSYWMQVNFYIEATEGGGPVNVPRVTVNNITSGIDYDLGTGNITTGGVTYNNVNNNSDSGTAPGHWDINPPPDYPDPSTFDDPDNYPDYPYYHRAMGNNISFTPSTLFDPVELPEPRPTFEKASLGGRGATTYRDALTPRWTDRDYYRNSSLVGAITDPNDPGYKADNYDTYYKWGSVGSISRVGRY